MNSLYSVPLCVRADYPKKILSIAGGTKKPHTLAELQRRIEVMRKAALAKVQAQQLRARARGVEAAGPGGFLRR